MCTPHYIPQPRPNTEHISAPAEASLLCDRCVLIGIAGFGLWTVFDLKRVTLFISMQDVSSISKLRIQQTAGHRGKKYF